jgi:ribose/xylose/arabinose/galactoside ABC-type transport system permease subunit
MSTPQIVKEPQPAPAAPPTPATTARKGSAGQFFLSSQFQGAITFLAFLTVFIVFAIWLGEGFTNVESRVADIHQNAPVLLLGLAALVTLIAGKFDLSIASMATLTAFLVVGLPAQSGWPFGLAVVACLGVGLLGGLLNGILVVRLEVNTFIATLGTGGVFGGFAAVYSKGSTLTPSSEGRQLPGWFAGADSFGDFGAKVPSVLVWAGVAALLAGSFFALRKHRPAATSERTWTGISVGVVVAGFVALLLAGLTDAAGDVSWTIGALLVVAAVLWVLLNLTTYGRYLHAVGSNPEAARLAGVSPGKETIKAFALGGVLAASAGMVLSASQGSASPSGGSTFLLPAFAAAFLSTVVLSTGRFTVWGTIIGGTFLVWVSQGLIAGGLATTWTDVVNGALLVVAVALSMVFSRTVRRLRR